MTPSQADRLAQRFGEHYKVSIGLSRYEMLFHRLPYVATVKAVEFCIRSVPVTPTTEQLSDIVTKIIAGAEPPVLPQMQHPRNAPPPPRVAPKEEVKSWLERIRGELHSSKDPSTDSSAESPTSEDPSPTSTSSPSPPTTQPSEASTVTS